MCIQLSLVAMYTEKNKRKELNQFMALYVLKLQYDYEACCSGGLQIIFRPPGFF